MHEKSDWEKHFWSFDDAVEDAWVNIDRRAEYGGFKTKNRFCLKDTDNDAADVIITDQESFKSYILLKSYLHNVQKNSNEEIKINLTIVTLIPQC